MLDSAFFRALKPYLDAFAECDAARRLALLEQSLTADAAIWGLKRVFTGYAEISEKIDGFHKNWPNCRLALGSGLVCFNNAAHFATAIVGVDGRVLASGHSVVELAQDGRISKVLAFWEPPPALPESWPKRHSAPALRGSAGAA